jgi:hypothetical protein
MWIDLQDPFFKVGSVGYLVRTVNTSTGTESYSLRERPLRTNQSNVPRLTGWCGETDNRSRYAEGCYRIARFNIAHERAQIIAVTGLALESFLADDGYPHLAEGA